MQPTVAARRKRLLRQILRRRKLDILLLYASNAQPQAVQWVAGVRPFIFHYFYVTARSSGFLEIDYAAAALRECTREPVTTIIEDLAERDMALFLKKFRRIGVAGPAPLQHFSRVRGAVRSVDDDLHPLLAEKSAEEIRGIAQSARVAAAAMREGGRLARPGITETALAQRIRARILAGAEGLSFPLCVVSGPRLRSMTAGDPSSRRIGPDDAVCVDMGAVVGGYASDMTRFFFLGKSPLRRPYAALCRVQKKVAAKLRTGMPIKRIPELYARELRAAGLPAETLAVGDLGHSLGFVVHEYPFLYRKEYASYRLVDRMVFTLEPEIEWKGWRLRVEDMLVMQGGRARFLT